MSNETIDTNERELTRDILKQSILRDCDTAFQLAQYQKSKADDFTSQIRFGLFALNCASLIALLGLLSKDVNQKILIVSNQSIVICFTFFITGAISSGISLILHQNHLIIKSGKVAARAMSLDTALNAISNLPESNLYKEFPTHLKIAYDFYIDSLKVYKAPIWLQSAGSGCWLAGIVWAFSSMILGRI